ncbi:MAG: FadR family transcriptional regulator [Gluconacetobacter diazotrophicus]|nr:FadR family transcriptional regulator [Gluconacetobacter diazotrophicus]
MPHSSRRAAVLPGAPVRRSRAMHDLALREIGSAIVRGDYPVGSLLPSKEELMATLDVSHTTIREALQTLTAKGMIVARARVGTRVLEEAHWNMFDAELLGWRLEAGMPRWLLAMLLEIRQSIEPLAAALAATHRSKADLKRLRTLLERMQDYPGNGDDGFVEADVSFHKLVLAMSGNSFMASLATVTSTALAASFQLSAPDRDPPLAHLVHDQHAAIVDAIEARDPQAASDAMGAAIRQGWTNMHGLRPRRLAAIDLLTFPVANGT